MTVSDHCDLPKTGRLSTYCAVTKTRPTCEALRCRRVDFGALATSRRRGRRRTARPLRRAAGRHDGAGWTLSRRRLRGRTRRPIQLVSGTRNRAPMVRMGRETAASNSRSIWCGRITSVRSGAQRVRCDRRRHSNRGSQLGRTDLMGYAQVETSNPPRLTRDIAGCGA